MFKFLGAAALLLGLVLGQTGRASAQAADPFAAIGGAKTCGPATGVLAAVNDVVKLDCPGAAGYVVLISPVSGQPVLVGTVTSVDTVTASARRFLESGSSIQTYSGNQGVTEYRTVGGGYGQAIRLTALASGQATVTILASYQPTVVFINGAVLTSPDVAVRQNRGFTISTGRQAVAAGGYLSLEVRNPAGNTNRGFLSLRTFVCDDKTNVNTFSGVGNPTANLAPTAVTLASRSSGPSSSLTAFYANGTTHPDVASPNALTAGGYLGPGSAIGTLSMEFERTVPPGTSYVNWLGPVIAATNCQISMTMYEESVN